MKHLLLAVVLVPGVAVAAQPQELVTVVGTGEAGFSGDGGPAIAAQLHNPFGVEIGPDGHLYLCDTGNHAIRRIDHQTGIITTVAGQGGVSGYAGDGGPATEALLYEPYEVRFDTDGNMLFVEMMNHVVRRIDARSGIISTVAGTGQKGFSGDGGPATAAQLNRPHSIVLDRNNHLFICDIANHRVRRVDVDTDIISTWCGTGKATGPQDGDTISDQTGLKGPRALALDAENNLWLALREGNQVVRFDRKAGVIHHIAGTGQSGFGGNGGPAAQATLSGPKGIVVDSQRQLVHLADTESHTVRTIDLNQSPPVLQLTAGTGRAGHGPDGDPLKSGMNRLHGVGLDPQTGDLYIGDTLTHTVRVLRRR